MQNYDEVGEIFTPEFSSDTLLTQPTQRLCLNCSDLDLGMLSTAQDPRANLSTSEWSLDKRVFVSRKSDSFTPWIWDCNDTLDCIFCDFMTHCYFLQVGLKIPAGPCSILERTWKPKLEVKEPGGAYATLSFSDYTLTSKSSSLYPPECFLDIAAGTSTSGLTPRVSLIEPFFSSIKSVTALMEQCRAGHALCMIPSRQSDRKLTQLQVIDCISRQIVPAPTSCQFVALSYVWGPSVEPRQLDNAAKLPQTIEDAILVTTALGLQYLWVDSICITQNDGPDFLHQLHQMDLIYAEAEFTIIATGCDHSTGLFGISRERSLLHKRVYINGFTITTFFDQTWSFVQRSAWATRGWTFQESLLSKRRIFFAEDQVLWDCSQDWAAKHCHARNHNFLDRLMIAKVFCASLDLRCGNPPFFYHLGVVVYISISQCTVNCS
jgi:Heterokaryon incompatibility protein (HET)